MTTERLRIFSSVIAPPSRPASWKRIKSVRDAGDVNNAMIRVSSSSPTKRRGACRTGRLDRPCTPSPPRWVTSCSRRVGPINPATPQRRASCSYPRSHLHAAAVAVSPVHSSQAGQGCIYTV